MANIVMTPIGYVRNAVPGPTEDDWGGVQSRIELDAGKFSSDALKGLEEFSHVEVLFHLSSVDEAAIVTGSRHPEKREVPSRSGRMSGWRSISKGPILKGAADVTEGGQIIGEPGWARIRIIK